MDSTRAKLADAAMIATGGFSGALSKIFTDHNFWSTFVLILTAILLVQRVVDWWFRRLGLFWWNAEWRRRKGVVPGKKENGEVDDEFEGEDGPVH